MMADEEDEVSNEEVVVGSLRMLESRGWLGSVNGKIKAWRKGTCRLKTVTWRAVGDAVVTGIIYICHGYGEHMLAGYRETLAGPLCTRGWLVAGMDMAGHGRSTGQTRGSLASTRQSAFDVCRHLNLLLAAVAVPLPVVLLGFSYGAAIALEAVLSKAPNLTGLVLESPLLDYDKKQLLPLPLRLLGGCMGFCCPCVVLRRFPIGPQDDPLRVSAITAASASHLFHSIQKSVASLICVDQRGVPVLILHGALDPWVPIEGVLQVAECTPGVDLRVYDHSGHNIRYDDPNDSVNYVSDLLKWVENRFGTWSC